MNNRPQPNEYVPYQLTYVNLVGDEPILDILENLQESTFSFFNGLDAEKADYAYADSKWTIKEVLGHIIDAERTFAYRVLAFSRGQKELPGFDENEYVAKANFKSQLFKDLIDEFRLLREVNLYLFKSLTAEQLLMTGIASGSVVTVRAILYLIAGHEMHHLNIIKERYL
jgi:uncharacterized damage-inducible protein DinB